MKINIRLFPFSSFTIFFMSYSIIFFKKLIGSKSRELNTKINKNNKIYMLQKIKEDGRDGPTDAFDYLETGSSLVLTGIGGILCMI